MKQTKNNNKKIIIIAVLLLVLGVFSRVYYHYVGFLGVNTLTCIKGKYFYVNRLDKSVKDGQYVAFYFNDPLNQHYYKKGFIFIKFVGCTQGERLVSRMTDKGYGYFCNNRFLGYACVKSPEHPRCPKHLKFNMIIPQGYFYAMGTAYNSYDSRYYGLIKCSQIIGRGYKLF